MGTQWGMPGVRALRSTTETNLIWGGDDNQVGVLRVQAQMESALVDAGATPTSDIGAGLLLGRQTTGGQHIQWNSTATDGSEFIRGVLDFDFSTLDEDAVTEDHFMPMIVRAPLMAVNLTIQGAAFVGHADEFLARHALHGMHCILDDDPQGYLAGASWRQKIHTGDLTLTTADNYTRFLCHSADADFTLPAVANGLKFRFFMGENFELQISSATSVFLTGNDVTGDGVTYTTTGEQIGVNLEVEGVNIDIAGTNTPTWIVTRLVTPFSTDDYFATTIDT